MPSSLELGRPGRLTAELLAVADLTAGTGQPLPAHEPYSALSNQEPILRIAFDTRSNAP